MSTFFIDSSALIKRYVAEAGSSWVRAIADPGSRNILVISRIACVEVLSALGRRKREGSISPSDWSLAIQVFQYDTNTQYQIVEVDKLIADEAGQMVGAHPLRAYDAIQLASALRIHSALTSAEAPPLFFVSADDRLVAVAQSLGLRTENPNSLL